MHMIVLIQSKPGLGKSTLAQSVVAALNQAGITADRLSMGDTLRGISSGDIPSRFASEVRRYQSELSHHLPIPDGALTAEIVGEFCEQSTQRGTHVSVIDGYPRYELLLPGFQRLLAEHSLRVGLLVILEGSDELATQRITSRHRQALGVAENAAERLRNYAEESAPIVERLAALYPTLRVDAANELRDKTAAVAQAVAAALATQ